MQKVFFCILHSIGKKYAGVAHKSQKSKLINGMVNQRSLKTINNNVEQLLIMIVCYLNCVLMAVYFTVKIALDPNLDYCYDIY